MTSGALTSTDESPIPAHSIYLRLSLHVETLTNTHTNSDTTSSPVSNEPTDIKTKCIKEQKERV